MGFNWAFKGFITETSNLHFIKYTLPCPHRYIFCFCAQQPPPPPVSQSLLIHDVYDAPQSVGLLCTSDQLLAETSLTTHNNQNNASMPGWDSNPQSQQAGGRRPTPLTARPLIRRNIKRNVDYLDRRKRMNKNVIQEVILMP
jgi:hypothetical protein